MLLHIMIILKVKSAAQITNRIHSFSLFIIDEWKFLSDDGAAEILGGFLNKLLK